MADQKNQEAAAAAAAQPPPTAYPQVGVPQTDVESATALRRKKFNKCVVIIALLVVVQTAVFVAIDLTILRATTPKFRLSSVAIHNLTTTTTTTPSFNIRFEADYAVKNPNFGPFEYFDAYITFSYRAKRVGETRIGESRAKALSTKKMSFKLNATSSGSVSSDSNLGSDIASGALKLSVSSELRGQVHLIKVIRKDKYPVMKCTMTVDLVHKVINDLNCD